MAVHNIRGKEGEELAANHLRRLDYDILYANWRYGRFEIDLIALKDNILHFIEVKTRHTLSFGYPEEGVSRKKFRNLKIAATGFLAQHRFNGRIQFDILSITRIKDMPVEFLLIEDVYL